MPHRLIVAGEAYERFVTSKIIEKLEDNFILYPFDRHNILDSSNTVLRFSIQRESTGPSHTITVSFKFFYSIIFFIVLDIIPSIHSFVY